MSLFSNIIAPLIAGLFFLLYFVYFIIANPSRVSSYWYFIVFLVCMSIFSLGRPLQLILGPHPAPLIVVNVRVFLLCAVIAPVIILGSDLFNQRRKSGLEISVVSVGVLLGLTYVLFNTLGTKSSKVLFQFAGMTAYDNLTPERNPPFYGREVTIAVQVVTGALMFFSS
jgi:two-component system response regulator YesN